LRVSFAAELKRRKVLRVAVAYFFTGVAVLEAANLVLPSLFVPAWVNDVVVVAVVAGFPIALLLAWSYELVDGALRRQRDLTADDAPPPQVSRLLQRGAVPILLGCVILLAWRPWTGRDPLGGLADPGFMDSVAVLPVTNRTGDPANDHVAVAIAEEIVQHLKATQRIKVSDPFSVNELVQTGVVASELASLLGVRKLVRTSLYEDENGLSLNATITDPVTSDVLWSDSFTGGEASGHEAASTIAASFGIEFEGRSEPPAESYAAPLSLAHTTGHEALLEGARWLGRRTYEGISRARELFRTAVDADPDDARALASLSKVYSLSLTYRYRGEPDGYPAAGLALALADRAIALEPELAAGYEARGYITSRASGPRNEVAEDCRKILELDPNTVDGLSWCARVLQQLGWSDEAFDNAEKAIALDPRNAGRRLALALDALAAGRFDQAADQARHARALSPGLALPPLIEARALLLSGRPERCLDLDLGPYAGTRAACLQALGRTAEATAVADSLAAAIQTESDDPVYTDVTRAEDLSVYYAWIGDPSLSLAWLEIAFRLSPMGVETRTLESALFDRVRDDPTFADGLRDERATIWERVKTAAAGAR